jgi:acyl-CoA-dependent ceramide synthase
VVFFSFVRQSVLFKICYPIARHFGIRKGDKLARFGEQGYAILYFSFFGAWGLRIMSNLPTWWYNCPHFWIGTFIVSRCSNVKLTVNFRLPTLADDSRTQALLSHAGVVLVSAAYRPRPRSRETTERLQGTCCAPHRHYMARWVRLMFVYPDLSIQTAVRRWSYGINLTLIGNAVYASMDVPDFFFAMVKVLNYLRWERIQIVMFIIFIGVWT